MPPADREALKQAAADKDQAKAIEALQTVLDKHCLAGVRITAARELEIEPGPARPELAKMKWSERIRSVVQAGLSVGATIASRLNWLSAWSRLAPASWSSASAWL